MTNAIYVCSICRLLKSNNFKNQKNSANDTKTNKKSYTSRDKSNLKSCLQLHDRGRCLSNTLFDASRSPTLLGVSQLRKGRYMDIKMYNNCCAALSKQSQGKNTTQQGSNFSLDHQQVRQQFVLICKNPNSLSNPPFPLCETSLLTVSCTLLCR